MPKTKIKREDFVNRSYLWFLVFLFLGAISFFVGFGYLILYWKYIDVITVGVKISLLVSTLAIITYFCWRTYVADSKLLTSSSNKYMHTKPTNIDSRGINFPDSGGGE